MALVHRQSVESQIDFNAVVGTNFVPSETQADWVRWCYASINKHFDNHKGNYELYLEGDDRTQLDENEFAELRIDGPFLKFLIKGHYFLDIEINVLCQTHNDPRQHYKAQELVGVFTNAFRNIIPVYRYGNGPFDDGSLLGCFHLQRDLRESIDINYYGIIRQDTRLLQTTIEAHYRLELWTKGE